MMINLMFGKRLLKYIIGYVLGNNLTFYLLRPICRKRLIILYYHRIITEEERVNGVSSGLYVKVEEFNKQMKFLKKFYNFVSENDIVDAIENDKNLPNYSVWITFDDGWKDNYISALPILKKYNIPATFFVTTGYVNRVVVPDKHSDRDVFMDWQEIREVAREGISIGAHTVSHRLLSNLSDIDLEKEITESKNEIEQRLGKSVISFAYPVGKKKDYHLKKCVPIFNENNLKLAVTTIGGSNIAQSEKDRFNLRRMGLSYEDTMGFFKFKINLGSFWQR
jgi:peptidoglycan/xylan/chitin deacetylase (PgdA/CDA1 family)